MTLKHINFIDSSVMRELEKNAVEKGVIKAKEVVKVAAKVENFETTDNLYNDLINLVSGMKRRGFTKEAEILENKANIMKIAETHLYRVFDEDGEDLVDFAHPDGDIQVAPAKDRMGEVETILSVQDKIKAVVNKVPSGKQGAIVQGLIKGAAEVLFKNAALAEIEEAAGKIVTTTAEIAQRVGQHSGEAAVGFWHEMFTGARTRNFSNIANLIVPFVSKSIAYVDDANMTKALSDLQSHVIEGFPAAFNKSWDAIIVQTKAAGADLKQEDFYQTIANTCVSLIRSFQYKDSTTSSEVKNEELPGEMLQADQVLIQPYLDRIFNLRGKIINYIKSSEIKDEAAISWLNEAFKILQELWVKYDALTVISAHDAKKLELDLTNNEQNIKNFEAQWLAPVTFEKVVSEIASPFEKAYTGLKNFIANQNYSIQKNAQQIPPPPNNPKTPNPNVPPGNKQNHPNEAPTGPQVSRIKQMQASLVGLAKAIREHLNPDPTEQVAIGEIERVGPDSNINSPDGVWGRNTSNALRTAEGYRVKLSSNTGIGDTLGPKLIETNAGEESITNNTSTLNAMIKVIESGKGSASEDLGDMYDKVATDVMANTFNMSGTIPVYDQNLMALPGFVNFAYENKLIEIQTGDQGELLVSAITLYYLIGALAKRALYFIKSSVKMEGKTRNQKYLRRLQDLDKDLRASIKPGEDLVNISNLNLGTSGSVPEDAMNRIRDLLAALDNNPDDKQEAGIWGELDSIAKKNGYKDAQDLLDHLSAQNNNGQRHNKGGNGLGDGQVQNAGGRFNRLRIDEFILSQLPDDFKDNVDKMNDVVHNPNAVFDITAWSNFRRWQDVMTYYKTMPLTGQNIGEHSEGLNDSKEVSKYKESLSPEQKRSEFGQGGDIPNIAGAANSFIRLTDVLNNLLIQMGQYNDFIEVKYHQRAESEKEKSQDRIRKDGLIVHKWGTIIDRLRGSIK